MKLTIGIAGMAMLASLLLAGGAYATEVANPLKCATAENDTVDAPNIEGRVANSDSVACKDSDNPQSPGALALGHVDAEALAARVTVRLASLTAKANASNSSPLGDPPTNARLDVASVQSIESVARIDAVDPGSVSFSEAAAVALRDQKRVFDSGNAPPEIRAMSAEEYGEFLRLNDLAPTLGSASDFNGQIKAREQQLQLARQSYGETHPILALLLCDKATAFAQIKDVKSARAAADQAKAIIVKTWGPNSFEYAYLLSVYASISRAEKNAVDTEGYLVASATLFDGLIKARPGSLTDLPNLADYYYFDLIALASFYDDIGDPEKSVVVWQKALDLCEDVFGPNSTRTQAISRALAAESAQRDGVRQQEMEPTLVGRMPFTIPFGTEPAIGEPSLQDLKDILTLNEVASSAAARGDYKKAAAAYEAILPIYSRTYGPAHPENLFPLLAAAVSWSSEGEFEKASQEVTKGIDLARQTFGEMTVAYATALNVRGTILMTNGKFEDAEADFSRSLKITDRLRGPDFLGGLEAMEALGGLHLVTGDDIPKAIALLDRAIDVRNRKLGGASQDIVALWLQKGLAFRDLGRAAEGESAYLTARAMTERLSGKDSVETAKVDRALGDLYVEMGRFSEAETQFNIVLKIQEQALGANASGTLETLSALIDLYNQQNRQDKSKPLLARAIGAQELLLKKTASRDPRRLLGFLNLIALYLQNGDFEKATALRRQNAAQFQKLAGGNGGIQAFLQSFTVLDYLSTGHWREAQDLVEALLPAVEQAYGANSRGTQIFLGMLTTARLLNGDLVGAEEAGQKHVVVSEALLGHVNAQTALAYSVLAAIQIRKGEAERALETARTAVEIERTLRLSHSSDSRQDSTAAAVGRAMASLGQAPGPGYAAGVWLDAAWKVQAGQVDPKLAETAFQMAQDADITPSGQSLALAAARAHGTRQQADLAKQYEEIATNIQVLDLRLAKALGRQDDAATEAIRVQLSNETKSLVEADAKVAKAFPAYAGLIHPRALAVTEVQAMLGADQAVILVHASGVPAATTAHNPIFKAVTATHDPSWDEDRFNIFVVTKTHFSWHRISGAYARSETRIAALLCQLDTVTCGDANLKTDPEAFDLSAAYGLYQDTFEPVAGELERVKRLFVVTPGMFGALPLHLLVTSDPAKTPMSVATAPWLADRFAMTVLPSLSNLAAPRASPETATRPAFIGYGAPLLAGAALGSRAGDVDAGWFVPDEASGRYLANPVKFRGLASLAGTTTELQRVASALGVRDPKAINTGALDDEGRFKSDASLKTARVISIATHGILPPSGDLVIEPSLVFTPPQHSTSLNDGLLTASEVMGLNFTADWIVLSACNTAVSNDQGDSLSALSRAFLFAGAKGVLAAHWRISDEATAQLIASTLTLYTQGRSKGLTKALALQQGMQALRKDPRFVHPRYWASFTTISGADN